MHVGTCSQSRIRTGVCSLLRKGWPDTIEHSRRLGGLASNPSGTYKYARAHTRICSHVHMFTHTLIYMSTCPHVCCVCMHARMCAHSAHIYACILMHIHTHAHTHTGMHARTHTGLHTGTHARMHTGMHAHRHACTQACMHACTQACMHACTHTVAPALCADRRR